MRKKFLIAFLIMSLLLTGCSSSFQMTLSDVSLIRVGEESMGEKEAKLLLMNMKCSYEQQYIESYGIDFWENEMESDYTFREYFLDNDYLSELCALLSICGAAKDKNISLTKTEEEMAEKAAKEYYASLTEEEKTFTEADESDAEKLYKRYCLAQKWIAEVTKEVPSEISEEEARIVQIKQIYVTDRKIAEEVWNQAVLGANFDSLAAVYNKSEEYICYLSRLDRSKKTTDIIFSMKNGQVSDILEENGGYYIMLCVNSYEKERTKENKETVYRQNVYQCWHDIYAKNIKNETISRNNQLWNRMDLSYNENITNHSLFTVYESYFN